MTATKKYITHIERAFGELEKSLKKLYEKLKKVLDKTMWFIYNRFCLTKWEAVILTGQPDNINVNLEN